MPKKILISFIVSVLVLTGCSLQPFKSVIVKSENPAGKKGAVLIDINDAADNFEFAQKESKMGWDINWLKGGDIKQKGPCHVKYDGIYYLKIRSMVVKGNIPNVGDYPVILDTGAEPDVIILHDIHVIKNKLPIFPFGLKDSFYEGFCSLPELRIGNITFNNFPALYQQKHVEIQMFALPVARDKSIIIGLPIMKRFKYIRFDNTKKIAELSLNNIFEFNETDQWEKFPITIKEKGSSAELFVKIPVAGKDMELILDTGSGGGLDISQDLWKQINQSVQNIKFKNSTDFYPFWGRLPCKKGVISQLKVGDKIIKNAKVSVFPNDNRLMTHTKTGLLGMQFFENSQMVLDFHRNILWIKREKSD